MMTTAWNFVAKALFAAAVLSLSLGAYSGASAQTLDPTLQKIKDSNTLVIGHRVESVPFSFVITEQINRSYGRDYGKREPYDPRAARPVWFDNEFALMHRPDDQST